MNNSKAKIIAVANQKGGVAKTTSVINIGAGLALRSKKILLVDTDNQSHLSRFLGYDGTDGKPTISELIWQTVSKVQKPVSEAIRKSGLGVDYIPSNFMLAGIISILGTDSDSTGVFSRLFSDGTFDEYDYIIIDCPPTLGILLVNALVAADGLIIPTTAEAYPFKGLTMLTDSLANVQRRMNPSVKLVAILITRWKGAKLNKAVREQLMAQFEDTLLPTYIRENIKVAEAPLAVQTLIDFDANSNGAVDYDHALNELMERI